MLNRGHHALLSLGHQGLKKGQAGPALGRRERWCDALLSLTCVANFRAKKIAPERDSKLPPAVNSRSRQHRNCENSAKKGKKLITPGISGANAGGHPLTAGGSFESLLGS